MAEKKPAAKKSTKKSDAAKADATPEVKDLLCADITCVAVQERKLLTLQEGIDDLDKILDTITGICKEPTCPFFKMKDQMPQPKAEEPKKKASEVSCDSPFCKVLPRRYDFTLGKKPSVDDYRVEKLCKHPACYNAYMGFRTPGLDSSYCSPELCNTGKKNPCEKGCGSIMCPFGPKQDPRNFPKDWQAPKPTTSNLLDKITASLVNYTPGAYIPKQPFSASTKRASNQQPGDCGCKTSAPKQQQSVDCNVPTCGDPSCPFTQRKNASATCGAPCGNKDCPNVPTCGKPTCPFTADPCADCTKVPCPWATKTATAGSKACPYAQNSSTCGAMCGNPSCCCGHPSCPATQKNPCADPPGDCGKIICPLLNDVPTCGDPSCPFTQKKNAAAAGGAPCGNKECPYAPTCGKPTCPFTDLSEIETCGNPSCPFTDPCADCTKVPCPWETKTAATRTYPCGSPSCPHVNPSGMICTHDYGKDYSFVQEASRPYCGSATPYDYLTSVDTNYPKPYADNYPTFESATRYDDIFCPFLSGAPRIKKTKKPELLDNCDPYKCPHSEKGVCGVYMSCGDPDAVPCESPECDYKKEEDPPCIENTCPYTDKFQFCQDCGGVVAERFDEFLPLPEIEGEFDEGKSRGELTDQPTKSIQISGMTEEIPQSQEKAKEELPVEKVKKEKKKKDKPKEEKTTLYQYPGVQIGHRDCSGRRKRIPSNMGWSWNIFPQPVRNIELWRGYRPGCMTRTVHKIIKNHHLGIYDDGNDFRKRRNRRLRLGDLKHCVEVKKKDGDFTITVNPLKDPKTVDMYESPFMDCTPMQFKIEKERVPKSPAYCPCDEEDRTISTKSSEIEFHFSPPAAIPPTRAKKKKVYTEIETQYMVEDLPLADRPKGWNKKKKKGGKKGKKKKC